MLTREGRDPQRVTSSFDAPRSTGRRAYDRLKYAVAATDVLSFVAAVLLTAIIRRGALSGGPGPFALLTIGSAVYLAVFAAFGLYRLQRLSPAEEFRRLLGAVSLAVSATIVLGFWTSRTPQRLSIGLTWVIAMVLTLATRRLWHMWITRMRGRGYLTLRTLIVGTNDEGWRLGHMLAGGRLGYRTIGMVRAGYDAGESDGFPIWGDMDRLEEAIRDSGAECLFVATSAVTPEQMAHVTKVAREGLAEVRLSSAISDIVSTRIMVAPVGNLITLSLKPVQLTGGQALTKRVLDVTLAFLALVVTAPFIGAMALAVKLSSRGPFLYRQERVGRHGRRFHMLKLRTMVVGADTMLDTLRQHNEASGPLFKLRDDPRITRVGRLLRRFSLDELPQFWNVLRGDMSVVGPRPPLPAEVALYEDWHYGRLEVRPGITGLWQVRGRSQLPFDDYVRLDLYYIENWSLAFDLYILLKTVPAVLSGRGAF
jgi:exopolysaccharide biosynthesis polyprenyl glycosylphosphotransferase